MSVRRTHRFNPALALAGSGRDKAPGGIRATRQPRSMYAYTSTAVKRIVKEAPRRLLESARGDDQANTHDLLGYDTIARRDGVRVGLQSQINALICGVKPAYGGQYRHVPNSQDKNPQKLAVYLPVDCLNCSEVSA